MDDPVISLPVKGLTTGEVQAHLAPSHQKRSGSAIWAQGVEAVLSRSGHEHAGRLSIAVTSPVSLGSGKQVENAENFDGSAQLVRECIEALPVNTSERG